MDTSEKIEKYKTELVGYAQRIKDGEIGVYKDVAETLKKIHVLNALNINSIEEPTDLTYSELGLIGSILKKQYYQGTDHESGKKFGLKWLFRDVQNDDISVKMIEHRLNLYAQSGEVTKNTIELRNMVAEGKERKRRVLAPGHEHCEDCIRYAQIGWTSILSDELPLPMNNCQCRTNCKCHLEYE